ncbi:MAG: hypothetical protein AAGF76_10815 [Pseudomonadota bacterium]
MMHLRALFTLILISTPASAVTFDLVASGPFVESFLNITDTTGSISGSFTVDDMNGDGIINAVDVIEWSFTGSGFADPTLNVTLSSTDPNAVVTEGTVAPEAIGSGLSAGILDFLSDDFTGIQVDFRANGDVDFFDLIVPGNPFGILYTTENFVVTPPPDDPSPNIIPLPATILPLALALGLLGFLRGRRRASSVAARSRAITA